jgi:hypothetical protein
MQIDDLIYHIPLMRNFAVEFGGPQITAPSDKVVDRHQAVLNNLAEAVVYAVDDRALMLARELSLNDVRTLSGKLDLVRTPHPKTWLEFGQFFDDSDHQFPKRTGIYIEETDEGFTAETVGRWGADHESEDVPAPEPLKAHFRRDSAAPRRPSVNYASDMVYSNNLPKSTDGRAIAQISRHIGFSPSRFSALLTNEFYQAAIEEAERAKTSPNTEIFRITLLCGIFLIMTVPGMVTRTAQDLSKLNKARHHNGKPPLRQFSRVSIAPSFKPHADVILGKISEGRLAARPHIVRGHFKRISKGLTWWHEHMRNVGDHNAPPMRRQLTAPPNARPAKDD